MQRDSLEVMENDVIDVLSRVSLDEVKYVRKQLRAGKFTGRSEFDVKDQCGCLLGTIALFDKDPRSSGFYSRIKRLRGPNYDGWGDFRPAEEFVMDIFPGDTPKSNSRAAELDDILTEFLMSNKGV